jgi:hypothetical protein
MMIPLIAYLFGGQRRCAVSKVGGSGHPRLAVAARSIAAKLSEHERTVGHPPALGAVATYFHTVLRSTFKLAASSLLVRLAFAWIAVSTNWKVRSSRVRGASGEMGRLRGKR